MVLGIGQNTLLIQRGVKLFGESQIAPPPEPVVDLTAGLLAYWKLDEVSDGSSLVGREDSYGSHHLYDTGGVPSTAGVVGNAVFMNRDVGHNLGHQSTPDLNLAGTSFNISGRFLLRSKPAADMVALSKYYIGTNQRGYRLAYEHDIDRMVFRMSNNGVNTVACIAHALGSPALNTWYYFDITYNLSTGQISFEVDRGPADRAKLQGGAFQGTGRFYLGRQDSSPSTYWDGALDDIAIHTRILNEAEKDFRYNNGSGQEIPDLPTNRGIIHIAGSGKLGFTASRVPFQRNCFHHLGRYWLFYGVYDNDTGPIGVYYITSTDGVTWEDPVYVTDTPKYDAEWTVVLDAARNHVHVGSCIEEGHTGFKYRRGELQADGSIVWDADWQIPWAPPRTMNDFSMCVTSDGHVWVSFGWEGLTVLRNDATDGTWSETAGFPLDLYHHGSSWCRIVTPLGADSVYVTSYKYGLDDVRARGYAVEADGTFVDDGEISEIEVESKSGEKARVGRIEGCGLGDGQVHIVYQSINHDIRYLLRNTDGTFEPEVVLSDSSRVVPAVSSPRISFDATGNLYIMWTDTASRAAWLTTNAGGTWSVPVKAIEDNFEQWYEHLMPAERLNGSILPLTYLDDGFALKWRALDIS